MLNRVSLLSSWPIAKNFVCPAVVFCCCCVCFLLAETNVYKPLNYSLAPLFSRPFLGTARKTNWHSRTDFCGVKLRAHKSQPNSRDFSNISHNCWTLYNIELHKGNSRNVKLRVIEIKTNRVYFILLRERQLNVIRRPAYCGQLQRIILVLFKIWRIYLISVRIKCRYTSYQNDDTLFKNLFILLRIRNVL